MISSYGDQSTTRNNPSYCHRAHQRCLNCSECFQRHLMFYTCTYNIRVTIEMVLTYFLHESDPRRDHQQIVLIHFTLHALALHLAVKILLINLSVWRLSTLALHTSVGCISLQNASRTALCYATNTIKENIPREYADINHQQNTRRSDQIETIKTIMQTTRPCVSHGRLPLSAQVAILKKIFDQVRKD